jgi:hypothetical protein
MRWSKLKQLIENNFTESVKPHVSIHSAAYGNCSCGHAWLTYKGEVIANFCTRAYYNRYQMGDKTRENLLTEKQIKKYENQYVEYGEMHREDIYDACWSYVHDLSFEDAIKSDNPLIQSLMVLDKRLGKRRINGIDVSKLHPLANKLLEIRKTSEV